MSTKIAREKTDPEPRQDWQPSEEWAPSQERDDQAVWARRAGLIGLMLMVIGAVTLLLKAAGRPTGLISPNLAALCVLGGLLLLLFHAANDRDYQIRRTYGMFGFVWLLTAALLFAMLGARGAAASLFGSGYACLWIGLLFLMGSIRHETDAVWRSRVISVIGALGLALALVGFVGGNIGAGAFLLPYGLLLAAMGLAYLWAFAVMQGTNTTLGYRAGVGMGLLGLLVFAVALARTVLPPLFFSWGWLSPPRPEPYLVPTGLLLMGLGVLYALVSVGLVNDNTLVVLTRRELSAFFYSPIAYIVLFCFAVIGWMTFWMFLNRLTDLTEGPMIEPIVRHYIIQWWPIMIGLVVGIPVITMHLLSEEKRTGSLEFLLTAPVTETSVVLSKFLAALIFFMVLWIPWGFFLIALRIWGQQPFDYRPLLSFSVALLFSGAAFVSMGLFFSSLVRSQIASAILTAMAMLFVTAIFFIRFLIEAGSPSSPWVAVLKHASYVDLWIQSLNGLLVPQLLLFPISMAVFWLFVTVKVLEARRWS